MDGVDREPTSRLDADVVERGEALLLGPPVVIPQPAVDEGAQHAGVGGAQVPASAGQLVRPAGAAQAIAQVLQHVRVDGRGERGDGHSGSSLGGDGSDRSTRHAMPVHTRTRGPRRPARRPEASAVTALTAVIGRNARPVASGE